MDDESQERSRVSFLVADLIMLASCLLLYAGNGMRCTIILRA